MKFDTVESALAALKQGHLIILLDDEDREYEGDLIGAATLASPEIINFMVTHGRGAFIAVFTPHGWCEQLEIGPMGSENDSFNGTQFKVAVDARNGGSGSSARDRAMTVNLLGRRSTQPADFVKPGHVVPIEAHPEGLTARRGHTEAGVTLMQLAGFDPPVAVDLEILDDQGEMAKEPVLFELARQFDLRIITVQSLVEHLQQTTERA